MNFYETTDRITKENYLERPGTGENTEKKGPQSPLRFKAVGNREPPVLAESLGGNLDSGRSLTSFVFISVHHADHPQDFIS